MHTAIEKTAAAAAAMFICLVRKYMTAAEPAPDENGKRNAASFVELLRYFVRVISVSPAPQAHNTERKHKK